MIQTNPPRAGCEWYAERCGWRLRRGNVMVEGTSDVAYFQLASRLFQKKHGRRLIDEELSIFAAGVGDDGGTYGISEKFPTLFNLAALDLDAAGRCRFKTIALLDDDSRGRQTLNGITKGNRQIREFESIFCLKRTMPLKAGSTQKLAERVRTANAAYKSIDCVVEDLLSKDLCDRFIQQMPHSVARPADTVGDGVRRRWTEQDKRRLREFAEESATLGDVLGLVEVLKALRSYLGLSPVVEGDSGEA